MYAFRLVLRLLETCARRNRWLWPGKGERRRKTKRMQLGRLWAVGQVGTVGLGIPEDHRGDALGGVRLLGVR